MEKFLLELALLAVIIILGYLVVFTSLTQTFKNMGVGNQCAINRFAYGLITDMMLYFSCLINI